MQPLRKQAEDLRARVASACQALHIDARAEELAVLDEQLADSNVWANVERAQMLTRQAASLRSQIEPWQILRSQISDIVELMDLGDDSMLAEFTEQLAALEAEHQERRKDLLFSGEYDNRAAILKLSAGAGGTDAQDWAEMLERMYLRWAEKHDMQTELVSARQVKRPVSRMRHTLSAVLSLTANCAVNTGCTGWCGSVRLTLIICGRLALHWSKSCRKWTRQVRLRSTTKICGLTFIAAAATAGKESIQLIPQCASLTCRQARWWRSKTSAASSKTKKPR